MSDKSIADTIVAVATPAGKGAVSIVRVSGPRAAAVAARMARTRGPLAPRVATPAVITDERGDVIDRALALYFSAPASYTGEDVLELHLHGSPVVTREAVRAAIACGARYAAAGEFTRRAFLNGKLDLHAASAVADIIDAETRTAARAALANLGSGLTAEVERLRALLATRLEELAGAIDFPEEVPEPRRSDLNQTLSEIGAQLEALRRDGERGRLLREGVHVAIVGPPNAGKSSLLNALLGEDRAIVSELPGTTRDTIEELIVIDGVAVRLVDTAGIRTHADRLEAAGVERTRRALEAARIAVVVIDGSQALTAEALAIVAATNERARVLFFNKADLGDAGVRQFANRDRRVADEAICGSTADAETLASLRSAIARLGWESEAPDLQRPHIASLREFDAVNAAIEAIAFARETLAAGEPIDLCVGDLARAFSALGHVSERIAAEEVLDGVFSRFCIGK
jgi:tRNA modification GTPase